jgi:aryl-alcohol dehydrogenase-like predicted oxidoreductase
MTTNDGDMVNQVGLSRKHIFAAVDAKALNDVVESGKARYLGASSVRFLIPLMNVILISELREDVHMAIPSPTEYREGEGLASVYQHAGLL